MAVADYFALAGNNYLAVADRFTGWIQLYKMDGKAMTLIKTLWNLFSQMGVPEEVATDGGPSFTRPNNSSGRGDQAQAVLGSLPSV